LTNALITAFNPGQSPPPVAINTLFFIYFFLFLQDKTTKVQKSLEAMNALRAVKGCRALPQAMCNTQRTMRDT
jgi:hypothetical protein